MVDRPGVIWILLVVLAVVGGVAAVGIAAGDKRKQLAAQRHEGPAGGRQGIERSVRDLRVGDVLTIDGRDFLCEGTIAYDEDGHRWRAGRCVDGNDVRWLVVGIERTGTSATAPDDAGRIDADHRLSARGDRDRRDPLRARQARHRDVRAARRRRRRSASSKKDRPEGHVERCRWWLYSAPGEDTLIVEQWGADYRLLRGKKIVEGTIDLIPAAR